MSSSLRNILKLTWKELISLKQDTFMVIFVIYSFTFAVYSQATGIAQDLRDASVAVVDEDNTSLTKRIIDAILPPEFQKPVIISRGDVDRVMDRAQRTFVVIFPAEFQSDVQGGRSPTVTVLVDATAMMQAGLGSSTLQRIINDEVANYVRQDKPAPAPRVSMQIRAAFNQGLTGSWFTGTMGMLNNITMLSVLLAGAALLREREHGTLEHLLVMPVTSTQIMLSKILANGLVIIVITTLCVLTVIRYVVGVKIAGSVPLFVFGTGLYLFFCTSLGIFLGTVARSMPQLGLLFILIVLPMNLLSGSNTPVESMPPWMQEIVKVLPSAHFVSLAQIILFRGGGLQTVWTQFLVIFGIGALFFTISFIRFRSFLSKQ